MENLVKEITFSTERKLEIYYDENSCSPREWDNLGTMVCFHRRYQLGDSHSYNFNSYNSWVELENQIIKDNGDCLILPLYLYDHSGITMNTTGFSCHFDSGRVGLIYVSKNTIRKDFGVKKITKKLLEQVKNILISEVKCYDQYISVEVYGYVLLDSEGLEIDSCWGFFGNFNESGILECLEKEEEKEFINM